MTMKKLIAEMGALDVYSRTVPIVASTPAPVEGEALTKWDLSRFMKNPVILWGHDSTQLPIGRALDVMWDPTEGLKMNVRFAHEKTNPLAEQVFQGTREKMIRAVSVGYDYVDAQGNTSPTPTGLVQLSEVSFVPIGLDEDAGTPDINPDANPDAIDEPTDEEMKKQVSAAARALGLHRARVRAKQMAERTDQKDWTADDWKTLEQKGFALRIDRGSRLGKVDRTQVGGARVPARLSRTGVLTYMNPDGTLRRELRLDSEIFKTESLATLEHAPVIDIKDHTGMVTPQTWRKVSLGHVTNARMDGEYIASDLIIQDAETLDAIDNEERTEISLGYVCKLDMTPGVHHGQQYDCVQRNIRYNHAALCPPNRGRAGREVGLRLDTNSLPWSVSQEKEEVIMTVKIRLDGADYEVGSEAHLGKLDTLHKGEVEKLRLDAKEEVSKIVALATKEKEVLEGRLDATTKELEQVRLDGAKKDKKAEEALENLKKSESERILRRVRLMRMALRFFGDKEDEKDEVDEEKMDGMTDREIHLAVIKKRDPNFVAEGKSDDYIQSRFDTVMDLAKDDRSINGVVRSAEDQARRLDTNGAPNTGNIIGSARAARDKAYAEAHKTAANQPPNAK